MSSDHRSIGVLTRRQIAASFSRPGIIVSGVLPEDVFLARVFRLADLPAHDHSLENMASEVYHHRVARRDWEDDWLWRDPRLDLMSCPDSHFLGFLQAALADDVQPDKAVRLSLVEIINAELVVDGWSLSLVHDSEGTRYLASTVKTVRDETLQGARAVAGKLGAYVGSQVTRMEGALDGDPELAIGTAKEFIETICWTILSERGVKVPTGSLHRLVQLAAQSLTLLPAELVDGPRHAERIERLLMALASVGLGLAELRNPFGTGHGKPADYIGLERPHAALAVRSAVALGVFLFEIHDRDRTRDCCATEIR
jgi:hypothetical protein